MADPFGRALLDHYRGERDAPLYQRDGEETLEHPVEAFYFGEPELPWLLEDVRGPVVDLGAGSGRTALALQERAETVAVEVSEHLVELLEERGVEDARRGDMFALRASFERDRFRTAVAVGTQLGLAGSMAGLRAFLGDLAHVTTPDATALVDCYDPGRIGPGAEVGEDDARDEDGSEPGTSDEDDDGQELLGFRPDPAPGLAHRAFWFEYEGEHGDALLFRLFSPGRLREAATGTGWRVAEVAHGEDGSPHYWTRLEKR